MTKIMNNNVICPNPACKSKSVVERGNDSYQCKKCTRVFSFKQLNPADYNCKYCGSPNLVRNGISLAGKRLLCKDCGRNFTPGGKRAGNPRDAGKCLTHPDRRAYAFGMCEACYKKEKRREKKSKTR